MIGGKKFVTAWLMYYIIISSKNVYYVMYVIYSTVRCLGHDVKLHPVAGLKLGREWVLGNVELPLNCHYSQVHSDPEW